MNPELKKRWVEALRSGEYQQGEGFLRTKGEEYCCLGVLASIAGCEWEVDASREVYCLSGNGISTLSDGFADELGVRQHEHELMSMNDGYDAHDGTPKTFPEIADYIEANL